MLLEKKLSSFETMEESGKLPYRSCVSVTVVVAFVPALFITVAAARASCAVAVGVITESVNKEIILRHRNLNTFHNCK